MSQGEVRNLFKHEIMPLLAPAVCIGLQLNPVFSADMIRKSGNTFRATEEHIIYQMLLNSYYQNSIYECNEILQANNCKPLTKEE
jgi:hypothetical protein